MKFHTQLKAKDIFKFSLAYTYSGLQGLLTIFILAVGIYTIATGISNPQGQTNVIFGVIVMVLFLVINPLMLYVKAKKQAIENPVYKKRTYYTLKEDGIFVELGEESATIEWGRVFKISHFLGLTLLYTAKRQAFVFPDYEFGSDKDKFVSYMEEHVQNARKQMSQPAAGSISKYSKAALDEEDKDSQENIEQSESEESKEK